MYFCDPHDQVIEAEAVTKTVPWSMTRIVRDITKPGMITGRPPALGEMAVLCVSGMLRFDVEGFSTVLREGDTIQFSMTKGFEFENVGDEPAESISIATLAANTGW